MLSEIISIGDELLIGQVINSNAAWIAQQLNSIGISVSRINVVADNHNEIISALSESSSRVKIVITTGGLGPTKDDITKPTICEYFKSKLVFNEDAYQDIVSLFSIRSSKVTEINKNQAMLPDNCIAVPNKEGTARGMWFDKNGVVYIFMPGVPFEMKTMVTQTILPELIKKFTLPAIVHKTILTQGIGESYLSEIIASWENGLPSHIKLAYLPSPGIVRLRLTAKGENKTILQKEVDLLVKKLEQIIPQYIYGMDEELLESIIGKLLREKKQTISTAESCTGGYIAHLITSIPGSSDYFTGSIVSYDNRIKIDELDVDKSSIEKHGAVSKEVVLQMAENIKKKFNTDYSIATSGVFGPDGGTAAKPIGTTWIAIASPHGTIAEKFLFGENRERNIRKTALQALNMLRKLIVSNE